VVVSGVLEPPPPGFQPAAPPSELRDQGCWWGEDPPEDQHDRGVRLEVKQPPVFAAGGTLEPAAGIEPAASRLRGERPSLQDLAGTVVMASRGVAGGTRTLIPGVAHRDPRRWTTTTRVAVVRWTPGRDSHPRDTDCSRAPRSSATGRWLPGTDSNRRLPGNNRTSFRSTTWHGDPLR
jgi:hypothetical protein